MDESGKITTFIYDANGNVETIVDAEGHVTQFTHDQVGNVLTITEGVDTPEVLTRTMTRDKDVCLEIRTDPKGRIITW